MCANKRSPLPLELCKAIHGTPHDTTIRFHEFDILTACDVQIRPGDVWVSLESAVWNAVLFNGQSVVPPDVRLIAPKDKMQLIEYTYIALGSLGVNYDRPNVNYPIFRTWSEHNYACGKYNTVADAFAALRTLVCSKWYAIKDDESKIDDSVFTSNKDVAVRTLKKIRVDCSAYVSAETKDMTRCWGLGHIAFFGNCLGLVEYWDRAMDEARWFFTSTSTLDLEYYFTSPYKHVPDACYAIARKFLRSSHAVYKLGMTDPIARSRKYRYIVVRFTNDVPPESTHYDWVTSNFNSYDIDEFVRALKSSFWIWMPDPEDSNNFFTVTFTEGCSTQALNETIDRKNYYSNDYRSNVITDYLLKDGKKTSMDVASDKTILDLLPCDKKNNNTHLFKHAYFAHAIPQYKYTVIVLDAKKKQRESMDDCSGTVSDNEEFISFLKSITWSIINTEFANHVTTKSPTFGLSTLWKAMNRPITRYFLYNNKKHDLIPHREINDDVSDADGGDADGGVIQDATFKQRMNCLYDDVPISRHQRQHQLESLPVLNFFSADVSEYINKTPLTVPDAHLKSFEAFLDNLSKHYTQESGKIKDEYEKLKKEFETLKEEASSSSGDV